MRERADLAVSFLNHVTLFSQASCDSDIAVLFYARPMIKAPTDLELLLVPIFFMSLADGVLA